MWTCHPGSAPPREAKPHTNGWIWRRTHCRFVEWLEVGAYLFLRSAHACVLACVFLLCAHGRYSHAQAFWGPDMGLPRAARFAEWARHVQQQQQLDGVPCNVCMCVFSENPSLSLCCGTERWFVPVSPVTRFCRQLSHQKGSLHLASLLAAVSVQHGADAGSRPIPVPAAAIAALCLCPHHIMCGRPATCCGVPALLTDLYALGFPGLHGRISGCASAVVFCCS